MADRARLLFACRRLVAAAALFAVATTTAAAQNVIVFVNGEPITAIDVDQRAKFLQLSTHKTPARQEVIDELINEKLKLREAKRWGIEISDSEVESMYASMGSRARLTAEQLTQTLAKSGIGPATVKQRIRAEQAWQQLVRGRYQASLQLSEKDVQSELEAKKPEENVAAYDYIMRPILFLVPPGSQPAVFESRRKDAEALRARFKSCEEGMDIARSFRDVAVRPQVTRSSADLPDPLRKMLEGVPVGQLTAPEVTRHGIEMFAICSKNESKADTPGKRQAREAVFAHRFEQQSKRYLQRLRREALIEPGSAR